jgi:hypothetical protein
MMVGAVAVVVTSAEVATPVAAVTSAVVAAVTSVVAAVTLAVAAAISKRPEHQRKAHSLAGGLFRSHSLR